MKKLLHHSDFPLQRITEITIGLITWLVITSSIWASFIIPEVIVYFIILMCLYWFWKSMTYSIGAIIGYRQIKKEKKIDWLELAQRQPNYDKIKHIVLIPNYQEQEEKLAITLNYLANQSFPRENLAIVLAMEGREEERAHKKANNLIKGYSNQFGAIFATYHPEIPGEVAGKSSNQAWAGRKAKEVMIDQKGWDLNYTTITSCDADSLLPKHYFSCLTYKFLKNPDRYHYFWQAHIAEYANIDRVILPVELASAITSVMRLSYSPIHGVFFIPYSTYSLSLKLIHESGYWDVNVIPEDWHMFFKAFFHLNGDLQTEAINLTIYNDAIEGENFFDAMKNRYIQNRRHAWGVTDIAYYLKNFLQKPKRNFLRKFYIFIKLYESHFLWPTSWFLLTLGVNLPLLVNPKLQQTVLGYNFKTVSGTILSATFIFTITYIILDRIMNPLKVQNQRWYQKIFSFIKWLLMPVFTLFVSTLPGLDAHTRLILNKKIEYVVAPKKVMRKR